MMSHLQKAIAKLAMEIHPDAMKSIADAVSRVSVPAESNKVGACGLQGKALKLFTQVLDAWREEGALSGRELSVALITSSCTAALYDAKQSVELVWSGPDSGLVPVRRTEQVLIDLIDAAQSSLFMVSFVAYEVPSVMASLSKAIGRGVTVSLLIESSDDSGGKLDVDSVSKMKKKLPGAQIYIWSPGERERSFSGYYGCVHAKCAVADKNAAFVTSANLTQMALDKNMELGIVVEGGRVPNQLYQHLMAMVATRTICLS